MDDYEFDHYDEDQDEISHWGRDFALARAEALADLPNPNDVFQLFCKEVIRTKKAILIRLKNGAEVWFPFSVVEVTKQTDNNVKVDVPRWLMREKGLI